VKYGKFVQSKGGIPVGGSDNNLLWTCFQASDKPVVVMYGNVWSGDSNEYYKLILCPPNTLSGSNNGSLSVDEVNGSLVFLAQNVRGGSGTAAEPNSIFPETNTGSPSWPVIPAYWTLAVYPETAASANDLGIRIAGFELDA